MIYGLVPIGGKGTRLGLTFSKEMLPQKGTSHFNPISNHLVSKMRAAGAEKIVFIHGFEFKRDVVDYFNSSSIHQHYLQRAEGFSNVLKEFSDNISLSINDRIFFGMPDTIFRGNPFTRMLAHEGVSCGLFTTNDESKVDRLLINENKFAVKCSKSPSLQDRFWGLLKFSGLDIINMDKQGYFSTYDEIGDIVNQFKFSCIHAGDYLDLGTWDNYNYYLKNF